MAIALETISNELDILLKNVCSSHGFEHAKSVLKHVQLALEEHPELENETKLAIELAALLHDADDHKLFKTVDYANARQLMRNIPQNISDMAIEMIDLVSCSKNGNKMAKNEFYLYPRYADRLEAIGKIGVWRCYKYCTTINSPLYTQNTIRFENVSELKSTRSRFENYNGNSDSMIDHFYDKLLHLADFESDNKYFTTAKKERTQPIIDTVMLFGRQGYITAEQINQICSED
eukprot:NODE_126_length_18761_cov_0.476262.p5 type:complete len:233 gc:universal NODE_126_length_18761_cov_0.476262:8995-9693(+)